MSTAVTSGGASIHGEQQRNSSRRQIIRMLVVVVISFFVCWAPFHIQRMGFVYFRDNPYFREINAYLFFVSAISYYLSSTINPILYNLMSAKYRDAFQQSLCHKPGLRRGSQSRFYNHTTHQVVGGGTSGWAHNSHLTHATKQMTRLTIPVHKRDSTADILVKTPSPTFRNAQPDLTTSTLVAGRSRKQCVEKGQHDESSRKLSEEMSYGEKERFLQGGTDDNCSDTVGDNSVKCCSSLTAQPDLTQSTILNGSAPGSDHDQDDDLCSRVKTPVLSFREAQLNLTHSTFLAGASPLTSKRKTDLDEFSRNSDSAEKEAMNRDIISENDKCQESEKPQQNVEGCNDMICEKGQFKISQKYAAENSSRHEKGNGVEAVNDLSRSESSGSVTCCEEEKLEITPPEERRPTHNATAETSSGVTNGGCKDQQGPTLPLEEKLETEVRKFHQVIQRNQPEISSLVTVRHQTDQWL